MTPPPHLLHVFSTFNAAGPQLRIASTINHLGREFRHTIIAMDDNFDAQYCLDGSSEVSFLPPPEKRRAWKMPFVFCDLLLKLRPNLVLTYNWGAIEAVAGTLLARRPHVIHNEAGFGADEATRRKKRRVLARRVLLRGAFRTLVPSKKLLQIAREEYRLPASKAQYIANGVDTERFRPGLERNRRISWGADAGSVLFGFVGLFRPEKNLEMLVRAFAAAAISNAKLVLVGDGSGRPALELLCRDLRQEEKVIFAGSVQDMPSYYAAFDVFVMSSLTEQMPMAMLEAMACGLPVITTDVGDVADILGTAKPPEIIASGDLDGYSQSLRTLATQAALRRSLGAKNRERCIAQYAFPHMAEEYSAIWRSAIGRMD